RCLLAMAEMDLRAGLAGAAIPATILVGTRDLLTPVRSARSLQQAWPRAGLRILPGAGHMLPLERPDDIVEAVLRATATQRERERERERGVLST
ncbi:MAG TPA: alpha/beta fold hydrolase, partial [Acidimicrobiales bacterium]